LIIKQKTRLKNFGNVGYRHRPQKSHIGRSLIIIQHINVFIVQPIAPSTSKTSIYASHRKAKPKLVKKTPASEKRENKPVYEPLRSGGNFNAKHLLNKHSYMPLSLHIQYCLCMECSSAHCVL